jgi:hypothetical protein
MHDGSASVLVKLACADGLEAGDLLALVGVEFAFFAGCLLEIFKDGSWRRTRSD